MNSFCVYGNHLAMAMSWRTDERHTAHHGQQARAIGLRWAHLATLRQLDTLDVLVENVKQHVLRAACKRELG